MHSFSVFSICSFQGFGDDVIKEDPAGLQAALGYFRVCFISSRRCVLDLAFWV